MKALAQRRVRRSEKPRDGYSVGMTALLWVAIVIYLFPILWFVLSSFKPGSELFSYPLSFLPKHPSVEGYEAAWNRYDFAHYFANTFFAAAVATIMTVTLSAITGYALAKYKNRWLKFLFIGLLMTSMLPSEAMLPSTFLVVRDIGLYNSLWGLIIPTILTPTGCFMFRQFFKSVPDEVLEAARIDGASEFQTFRKIMLPLSTPIMVTLAIFSFQWRWNDYILPLIVLSDQKKFTLQVALRSILGAEYVDWTVLLGASVISILPLLVIYLIFQKRIMGANLGSAVKG